MRKTLTIKIQQFSVIVFGIVMGDFIVVKNSISTLV